MKSALIFIINRLFVVSAMVPTKEYRERNLLTRIEAMEGPLGVLKECVDKRLRVKVRLLKAA